jgi:N-formylglutamate deformylase
MSQQLFDLQRGSVPLLISIPHLGTGLPDEIVSAFSSEAMITSDTDWHLDRLYGFARDMGASVLGARVSRYAIDLNRPPGGESLYPGQTTTGLCPTQTFRGEELYLPGKAPDQAEVDRRRHAYWQPYHDALQDELHRIQGVHGVVLLWEAHSMASVLPRLFEGKLPDLNFGTNSGVSCDASIIEAVLARLCGASSETTPYTHTVNGRFKGGYITRQYGRPSNKCHAVQLEMCQSLYMNEKAPFEYRCDLAAPVQRFLQGILEAALAAARTTARADSGP